MPESMNGKTAIFDEVLFTAAGIRLLLSLTSTAGSSFRLL
jgi:hypothetical protein